MQIFLNWFESRFRNCSDLFELNSSQKLWPGIAFRRKGKYNSFFQAYECFAVLLPRCGCFLFDYHNGSVFRSQENIQKSGKTTIYIKEEDGIIASSSLVSPQSESIKMCILSNIYYRNIFIVFHNQVQ